MKRATVVAATVTAALVLLVAAPASATPNMIRLGYPTCASCHLSPQGGGLLTSYGKGIDAAQTLRPVDLSAEMGANELVRLPYDVKFTLGVDREPPAAAGYSFNTSARAALAVSHRQYIVYGASVGSPTLARTRTSGAISVRMSRLYWMYQPKDGLNITVGRDSLPSGAGLLGFSRGTTSPSVSSNPTQAKVFWWNKRWQLTGYGFGPDGNETDPRFEARGGGAIIGLNVWKDRAVVGVQSRVSYADAYDRKNVGAFLRLGLTEKLGVLLEHDLTERRTDKGQRLTHVAGHSELFYVPWDWLQLAVAAQNVSTIDGSHTYRFNPSAQVRLNRNVAFSFDTTDEFTGVAAGRSRTYSVQLSLKAVQ